MRGLICSPTASVTFSGGQRRAQFQTTPKATSKPAGRARSTRIPVVPRLYRAKWWDLPPPVYRQSHAGERSACGGPSTHGAEAEAGQVNREGPRNNPAPVGAGAVRHRHSGRAGCAILGFLRSYTDTASVVVWVHCGVELCVPVSQSGSAACAAQ